MPVGVVHLLEVVDVDHHEADVVVEALGALDLLVEQLVEVADVREPGQLVGDRLARDPAVQVRVLERDGGLRREVGEQVALLDA